MSKAIFGHLNVVSRLDLASLAIAICWPLTAQQLTPDQTRCLNRGKAFSPELYGGAPVRRHIGRQPRRRLSS